MPSVPGGGKISFRVKFVYVGALLLTLKIYYFHLAHKASSNRMKPQLVIHISLIAVIIRYSTDPMTFNVTNVDSCHLGSTSIDITLVGSQENYLEALLPLFSNLVNILLCLLQNSGYIICKLKQ